ncbi:MAG: glycogen synthase GlgA [Candidatus Hydrogenedentes bacterium]|nr:glycogen synthase GlgA [Candidatus Hydrogenedentota bacterium]
MKILHVTSECSPLLSTGGLAEVSASLPKALLEHGHEVRLAMPFYQSIDRKYAGIKSGMCCARLGYGEEWGSFYRSTLPYGGVPLYLIEHEGFFGRPRPYDDGQQDYWDNAARFSFFCLAVLDIIKHEGWQPDIIHCHDWQTAALPVFLKTRYKDDPFWAPVKTLFTIHNLNFQGRYPGHAYIQTGLPGELFNPDGLEYQGDLNLMQGAIRYADALNTVSPRYAQEIQTLEYGAGMDLALRARKNDLYGILNGIDYDAWHPSHDAHIKRPFDMVELAGKSECKRALQTEFALPLEMRPLYCVVSRLTWQKGIDLIIDMLPRLANDEIQMIVLGTGETSLEQRLLQAADAHKEWLRVALTYDPALSHRIIAGSDYFLMPSRYEPCGLTQMYSMIYGALPVVRRTGGLYDTVLPLNPVNVKHGRANGIGFMPKTVGALHAAMRQSIRLYRTEQQFRPVQCRAMLEDFSWAVSSKVYESLYEKLKGAA